MMKGVLLGIAVLFLLFHRVVSPKPACLLLLKKLFLNMDLIVKEICVQKSHIIS